jgi:hypothetical protein
MMGPEWLIGGGLTLAGSCFAYTWRSSAKLHQRIDDLTRELSGCQTDSAKTYVTKAEIKDVENRITAALKELGERFERNLDRLAERLERLQAKDGRH